MAFFNPDATIVIRHGKLPHWRQEGVIYFVTFRLADSLPQAKLVYRLANNGDAAIICETVH
jgi:hypothetical protein